MPPSAPSTIVRSLIARRWSVDRRRVVTASLVCRRLKCQRAEAVALLESVRASDPTLLSVQYLARCDACFEPNEVTAHFEDIANDRPVRFRCGVCRHESGATGHNIMLEYWIDPESGDRLAKEALGETNNLPEP